MSKSCDCPPEAGKAVCESATQDLPRPSGAENGCPNCGLKGKPVQGQTVKALLAVSLREMKSVAYQFCKNQNCPVVYFSLDGEHAFQTEQLREHVYQKEPDRDDVLVCYCFRHSVGDFRRASKEERQAVLEDINAGIKAGQCACDIRNPQGSCCLGNVSGLIKRFAAN